MSHLCDKLVVRKPHLVGKKDQIFFLLYAEKIVSCLHSKKIERNGLKINRVFVCKVLLLPMLTKNCFRVVQKYISSPLIQNFFFY